MFTLTLPVWTNEVKFTSDENPVFWLDQRGNEYFKLIIKEKIESWQTLLNDIWPRFNWKGRPGFEVWLLFGKNCHENVRLLFGGLTPKVWFSVSIFPTGKLGKVVKYPGKCRVLLLLLLQIFQVFQEVWCEPCDWSGSWISPVPDQTTSSATLSFQFLTNESTMSATKSDCCCCSVLKGESDGLTSAAPAASPTSTPPASVCRPSSSSTLPHGSSSSSLLY